MMSSTEHSYIPGVPYPVFHKQNGLLVNEGGVWNVRTPDSIQCSSLLDLDPYIGELCLLKGCIVCRSVQDTEDVKGHISLYANITLDLRDQTRPATFDYSVMLDVFWSNRQTPYNSSDYLQATVTVGEDYESQQYWRIGHDKWTPAYDKTRFERRGTSILQYTYAEDSTAYLFVKVEMGLPSSFPVGLTEVMQFQSFSIDRPSLSTTLPPPSHGDPQESPPSEPRPLPTRPRHSQPSQVTVTWTPPTHTPSYEEPFPPRTMPYPPQDDNTVTYLMGLIIFLVVGFAAYFIVHEFHSRMRELEQLPIFAERAPLLTYSPTTANQRDYRSFEDHSRRGCTSHTGSTACNAPREPSSKTYNREQNLSSWAAEHRRQIPDSLEGKLKSARYLPFEDPDIMTEEDWFSQWGVSKMELQRLRTLYQQREDA